jgi:hypothetical protein
VKRKVRSAAGRNLLIRIVRAILVFPCAFSFVVSLPFSESNLSTAVLLCRDTEQHDLLVQRELGKGLLFVE